MDCERPSLKKFAKLSLDRDMQPRAIRSRSWLDLGFRLGIFFCANLENPALEILNEGQVIFSKPLESRRSEFAISYMETPLASQSGFAAVLKYQSDHDLSARLHFVTKKGDYFFELGRVKKNVCHSIDAYVMDPWAEGQIGDVTAGSLQRKDTCEAPNPENNLKNAIEFLDPIDLIIPVYNGYDFLDPLFASIPKTNMKFRVIIVNDASPDERIAKKIDEFTSNGKFDSIVITNETNQGFPKAVNSGLEESTGHVVLLNTDIELPDMWLERMITPLLEDRSVASVTPFTNSGTICSFPKFIEDNPIIDQLSVNAVDAQFRKMNPMYTELPTGVGFCMAMSRDALNDIGFFDCESFGRGYGEENDWCQRAIEHGYKNVIAENVFVYHKHGGSFESEDKRRLCEENMSKLLNKHPHYLKDVADFCEMDPLFQFRNYVEASIKLSQIPEVTIAFNHLLGGGADSFLQKEKGRLTETGMPVAIVSYSTIENVFHLAVEGSSCDFKLHPIR